MREFSPENTRELAYALKHIRESKLAFHGLVVCWHSRDGIVIGKDEGYNTFCTEGINHLLDVYLRAQTGPTAIYCGLFKNNVTPAQADTAAAKLGAAGDYGECQDADYDDPATNRATYTAAAAASASITNSASKAEFTMDASITVYGAFLTTTQAKTDTSGKLICAKKFTTSRPVVDGDELAIAYTVSCTTS